MYRSSVAAIRIFSEDDPFDPPMNHVEISSAFYFISLVYLPLDFGMQIFIYLFHCIYNSISMSLDTFETAFVC